MLRMNRNTKIAIGVAGGIFLLTAVLHIIDLNTEGENPFFFFAVSMMDVGLLIGWAISLNHRIIQMGVKRCLIIAVCAMVFWLLIRTCKYRFFIEIDIVCRHLWYSYYLVMTGIPLLLLFAALQVGRTEGQRLSRRWLLLLIPMFFVNAGIMTNDFHQLAFRFEPGFVNWSRSYSRQILYYIAAAWIIVLLAAAFGTIFYKCRIVQIRRRVWIPFVWLSIGFVYLLVYFFIHSLPIHKPFELPEIFCFMIVAFCESCIQTGLIPSNTGYGDFLAASAIATQLTDEDGSIRYHSKTAPPLAPAQMKQAQKHPVQIDRDTRLQSHSIGGGYIYWQDDLTVINEMNDELAEINEQLLEYNVLLQAEADLKKRRAQTAEKNRLYDGIAAAVSPQLERLAILLNDMSPDDPDLKHKYALACILNAYIKRRSNLALLEEHTECLDAFELETSIRESVEYLNVYGVMCAFHRNVSGGFSANEIILAYELFEAVVEAALPSLTALLINLAGKDGRLTLKICLEGTAACISPEWRRRVCDSGGMLATEEEDGTVFVTLRLGEGAAAWRP